jgi:hypothetical protein
MLNKMFLELSKEYKGQETNEDYKYYFDNGQQDIVIAHLYQMHHHLFTSTVKMYYGIDEMQAQDIVLTEIWKCLENFKADKSNGKITTMICKYIKTACRTYTQGQNTHKRKVNQGNVTSNFSEFESTDFLEKEAIDPAFNDMEMKHYLLQLDLTENQLNFCLAILDAPDDISMNQIAQEIGMSTAGVLGLKKQLRAKLTDLL